MDIKLRVGGDYLLVIENELYNIKISDRIDGCNICSYKIVTNEEYKLVEASGRKILHRLIYAFSLYKENFEASQLLTMITDLESIANELRISKEYVIEQIRKYWRMNAL